MPRRFSTLFRQHLDPFTRAWVDEVYADRRTDLATLLSFRELIEHIPDMLEELGYLLDERADVEEICEAARRVRGFARSRFHQGVLLDEVARELMLLNDALNEFLWHEAHGVGETDTREMHDALRCAGLFFDELIAQAILVYAASLRPVIPTRGSVWPPPRVRRQG
ncbi:MAG TPA: RsbRD N-terminal domain-containing protein [Pyrinomonadaceae bacterium]|nr:RsbRD N-terminal domain-containing protein [Pyrinomonadaceae bacterium]